MKEKTIFDNYVIREDGKIFKNDRKLSTNDNGRGYLVVSLTDKYGNRFCKSVHRLLAEAFIPNPKGLSDVDHIDGDRRNNSLSNLRWVSHGENIKHSYDSGRRSALGSNNARCKTEEKIVIEICEYLSAGLTAAEVRDKGYSYELVRAIKSKKNWKHISNNYSFL